MKICDFTFPELIFLEKNCNFTEEEKILFQLRSQNIPLDECAEILNLSISATKKKSQKINIKIKKVINI